MTVFLGSSRARMSVFLSAHSTFRVPRARRHPSISSPVIQFQANLRLNKIPLKYVTYLAHGRCSVDQIIHLRRRLFLARLLILIKKGGLLQLKFGGVGVGVNIYLWAR